MFDYYQIKDIHIELTDKCNASCAMCGRNENGGKTRSFIQQSEIDLKKFREIIPNALIDQVDRIRFCGNFGDPVASKDLAEICNHIKQVNSKCIIKIHTNGSLKTTDWWGNLAKILSHKKDEVLFAIDGLNDTHALYRKDTNFNHIISNAEAYISNGGHATWVMLLFKHNEHQVQDCHDLSVELGFKNFRLKKTKRFFDSNSLTYQDCFPVYNKKGEKVFDLEAPKSDQYRHEYSSIELNQNQWEKHLGTTDIKCKVQAEKSIYISAQGRLSPCCWLGAKEKFGDFNPPSLADLSIAKAMELHLGPQIPTRWELGESRCKTCARICGEEYKPFESQFIST